MQKSFKLTKAIDYCHYKLLDQEYQKIDNFQFESYLQIG